MSMNVKLFIEEIVALEKKYQLTLAHEDSQGAFIVERFKDGNVEWLQDAWDHSDEED